MKRFTLCDAIRISSERENKLRDTLERQRRDLDVDPSLEPVACVRRETKGSSRVANAGSGRRRR
jgi:hypothetical protein